MDLARLRTLLDRIELLRALEPYRWRDPRMGEWIEKLAHQHGGIEDSGARGLDRALGTLLDGVALRGSLRLCPEALRLEDVLDTCGLVLFKLDAAEYPHATRKIAAWVLLGMGRVAHAIGPSGGQSVSALLLVDEVGALGSSARHLRGRDRWSPPHPAVWLGFEVAEVLIVHTWPAVTCHDVLLDASVLERVEELAQQRHELH
jgi:hypothetical protein